MAGKISNIFPRDRAPDFNDPLGLLKACHQRILGFCELLEKIVSHVAEHGVDDDVKRSAQKIHRYFSTAAILHHQDEEQDLFPLLIRTSLKMATIIHGLEQDHIKLDEHWNKIAPLLAKPGTIEEATDFSLRVSEFCDAYRHHIKVEEEDFLSVSQHLLSKEQLQSLGNSMEDRRKRF